MTITIKNEHLSGYSAVLFATSVVELGYFYVDYDYYDSDTVLYFTGEHDCGIFKS